MKNIHQEIKKSLQLLDQLTINEFKKDTVGIGTSSIEEYDQLAEDILKISSDSKEDEYGLIVKLNESVDGMQVIRVRKPVQPNYIGIVVEDFDIATKAYPDAELESGEGWKFLKTEVEGGEIYISSVSEISFYFTESEPNAVPSDETEDLTKVLEQEKQKRITLMADFQNFQRRVEQEKATWGALSNMSLIKDLLEIYDDLQLAIQDDALNLDHAKSAITSAQDKLVDAAKRAGIEKVEVKVGDEFDKEKMEAVSMVPVQDESQKGKVIAVISSAYKYTNKEFILKAAKVVVGK